MSVIYRLAENACYFLNKLPGGGVKSIMMKSFKCESDEGKLPKYVYKKDMEVSTDVIDGFLLHKIRCKTGNSSKAVIFLPGGGGLARATKIHYDTALRLARMTGVSIYIAAYPLAPAFNCRFALDWLHKAYIKILSRHKAEDITLMGDSAGANLILSLTYREEVKPGGLIVISPACGLETGEKRDIRLGMESTDPILSVSMNDLIAELWCKNVPLESPDISPEYIDYRYFPKMHFFYGEHELFYPHVRSLTDLLRAQQADFDEVVKPMCHDWPLCGFFKEGKEAVGIMADYIG